ncbi:uncharacterized protein C11orf52 homolog [Onychostruthus taczanowskii]|uniref:uncharacterized protein C11orf52 homolog n=1 Tax=Onychostruthus taczanowskii TaxID=356909 RepID=UPI001B808B90|nr:uncharacterized protein C11orf52 homolog [Onychostruthus taczanowskii]
MAHGASAPKPDTGRHSPRARGRAGTRKYKLSLPGELGIGGEGGSDMGNLCGCGWRWKCPSPFKRKKEKQGANVRHEAQQQQPGRKAVPGPVPTCEDVPEVPVYATLSRPRAAQQEDSIHYADIQVFSRAGQRSAAELRSLQLQNATEYATLNFPRARLKYDSKNGTLV